MNKLYILLSLGLLLVGCSSGHPEFLTSTQLYLLVEGEKSPSGDYTVYELARIPETMTPQEAQKLKEGLAPRRVKTLGEFDRLFHPGRTYLLHVRKVMNKESREVSYTYLSEIELPPR